MTSKTSSTAIGAFKKEKDYQRDHMKYPAHYDRSMLMSSTRKDFKSAIPLEGRKFLSLEQLQRLSEHQGRHVGQSMMEPLMQPFWKKIAEYVPARWPANTIILVGLAFHSITTFILLSYCPDARGEAPKSVYCLCAFGLAVFFVLGAVDERQGKKTKSHTALRELIHHACHAFSNLFMVLGACLTVKLGSHPRMMTVEFFSMLFIFYSVHWQAYCSGIINFQYLDSMEIQVIMILLYIVTGVFGPAVWDAEVVGCPVKFLPVGVSLLIGYFCCLGRLSIVVIQGGVGKNGSTVAGTSILSPLGPTVAMFAFGYWIASNSQTFILHRYPVLFLVFLGIPLVKLSCKIVVSHMTQGEMILFDDVIYIPGLAFILQKTNLLEDHVLLFISTMISLFHLLWYCYQVHRDVCHHLTINCSEVQFSSAKSKATSRSLPSHS